MTISILVFSASTRTGSYNQKLATLAAKRLEKDAKVTLCDRDTTANR
jgi:NAD(P)H-dependent FMN reductase